ncbi:hypothetical protein [Winogradskyella sp. PG-2]|uniref:hypothetical protein n=1 Tax=Winogradskyella sp. PG-2 TaxID=754409 RepID=UPI000458838B|nr:hypothetical protein [Winogradskyella sp. PG-2]BAO76878.1 hypothetical protein WPG_2648 [Winogradskyella sp. PG-2]
MKKIIYIFLFSVTTVLFAQENDNGITLGSYIPEQAEGIPSYAQNMLINKLGRIITENGISDNVYNSRFIITPNITVLSKNITGTAPTMIALSLDLTLYIGDGVAGNLFSSESIQLKGVGTNENKAYMSALKQVKPKNKEIQNFISKGKTKILEYYNANCQLMLNKAQKLESQNAFEEALLVLTHVPEASDCFNSVKSKIKPLYTKAIERDCTTKLNRASAIWAANQDIKAANKAGYILSTIEPSSSCFGQVKTLYSKISARVKDLGDRDWNYDLKVLEVRANVIEAARDIGVAYGENQPQSMTYNVRGWY